MKNKILDTAETHITFSTNTLGNIGQKEAKVLNCLIPLVTDLFHSQKTAKKKRPPYVEVFVFAEEYANMTNQKISSEKDMDALIAEFEVSIDNIFRTQIEWIERKNKGRRIYFRRLISSIGRFTDNEGKPAFILAFSDFWLFNANNTIDTWLKYTILSEISSLATEGER